ncbi:hypothetical protein, partial [Pedobacter sp.]|uniref:hypothetical protein n=1 Tax=Pedobacter sp. TaxID=1411316 RepID=UPI002BECD5CA
LVKSIGRLHSRIPKNAQLPPSLDADYGYWFYPHILNQLARLFVGIKTIRNDYHRDFFLVCFSALLKKVSLADPRLSVPVRQRADHYPERHPLRIHAEKRLRRLKRINVISEFWQIVNINKIRIEQLKNINEGIKLIDIEHDARMIGKKSKMNITVDMIITSPPYNGAQKYTRASKLSLSWLAEVENITISSVEEKCIGREHFKKIDYQILPRTGVLKADEFLIETIKVNPLRAYIAATYLLEMKEALLQATLLLKRGGYFVLVAGNNYVCGREFMTVDYLTETIENLGFVCVGRLIDEIKSRGLMTKRNKTASLITREWVCIFQKK